MKLLKTLLVLTMPATLFFSCSNRSPSDESPATSGDSLVTDLHNGQRKIIKTADLRARVTDVYEVTHKIEQATRNMNGMVMESTMENTVGQSRCLE